jgi:asparagine synthase (glutamine-hydrolysing)
LFARIAGEDPCLSSQWRELLDVGRPGDPLFSHLPRFLSTCVDDFYSPEYKAGLAGSDVIGELRSSLPTRFFGWSPLNQASYLEMTTRLSPYVLGTRSDRMTMAHGVEGRYPFLDHRVFEFAASLPTGSRLRGLHGKEVLRRWAKRILPPHLEPTHRSYPAPEAQCFLLPNSPSWVGDHLTPEALRRVGVFSPAAVGGLVRRCQSEQDCSPGENEALIGVLTTQIWYQQFVESALFIAPLPVSHASVLLGDKVPVTSAHALYDPEPC